MSAVQNYGQGPSAGVGNVASSFYQAPQAPSLGDRIATGAQTPQGRAAQLLMPALKGNPFMTPEALQRLQEGNLPDLNMINPAFWQYTSPVITQALQGLYQSGGVRPEEQQFTAQQWTPLGLQR